MRNITADPLAKPGAKAAQSYRPRGAYWTKIKTQSNTSLRCPYDELIGCSKAMRRLPNYFQAFVFSE